MRFISTFILLCFLSACSSPSATPTAEPLNITPVESAFAPNDPHAAPPKEIIASHAVTFDTPNETRALFDLAAEPKEWQTYPGTAHGTELFETEHGEDVQNAILDFILKIADQ